jgi:hypothetical protein
MNKCIVCHIYPNSNLENFFFLIECEEINVVENYSYE